MIAVSFSHIICDWSGKRRAYIYKHFDIVYIHLFYYYHNTCNINQFMRCLASIYIYHISQFLCHVKIFKYFVTTSQIQYCSLGGRLWGCANNRFRVRATGRYFPLSLLCHFLRLFFFSLPLLFFSVFFSFQDCLLICFNLEFFLVYFVTPFLHNASHIAGCNNISICTPRCLLTWTPERHTF